MDWMQGGTELWTAAVIPILTFPGRQDSDKLIYLDFPSDTVTAISEILHAGDYKLSLQEIFAAFVPSCANWLSYG